MTKEDIEKLWLIDENDPRLLTKPKEVTDFTDVPAIVEHMFEVMKKTNGVGLSANQIGLDMSLFIMRWPSVGGDTKGGEIVAINPDITGYSMGDNALYEEGCLSFPGLYMWISRPSNIDAMYTNLKGDRVFDHLDGWAARIYQHEYEHMVGKTFKDSVSRVKLERAQKKRTKMIGKLIRQKFGTAQ